MCDMYEFIYNFSDCLPVIVSVYNTAIFLLLEVFSHLVLLSPDRKNVSKTVPSLYTESN